MLIGTKLFTKLVANDEAVKLFSSLILSCINKNNDTKNTNSRNATTIQPDPILNHTMHVDLSQIKSQASPSCHQSKIKMKSLETTCVAITTSMNNVFLPFLKRRSW